MKTLLPILSILLLLSCDKTTYRMQNFEVHGIDVSRYQSFINWGKIQKQGIHFAFAKATEGINHKDSTFQRNWLEMRKVGIKRGAYHFFRPAISAELQAQNFINFVEMKSGDLPPVLDVEVINGVSKTELLNGIRTWLFQIEINYNIKPIIYTNQDFFNEYISGHFEDYPIWIARYNSWWKPNLRKNKKWHFWQYGNRGKLEGINGNVDFNVFKGTLSELEELCLPPQMIISLKQ